MPDNICAAALAYLAMLCALGAVISGELVILESVPPSIELAEVTP